MASLQGLHLGSGGKSRLALAAGYAGRPFIRSIMARAARSALLDHRPTGSRSGVFADRQDHAHEIDKPGTPVLGTPWLSPRISLFDRILRVEGRVERRLIQKVLP